MAENTVRIEFVLNLTDNIRTIEYSGLPDVIEKTTNYNTVDVVIPNILSFTAEYISGDKDGMRMYFECWECNGNLYYPNEIYTFDVQESSYILNAVLCELPYRYSISNYLVKKPYDIIDNTVGTINFSTTEFKQYVLSSSLLSINKGYTFNYFKHVLSIRRNEINKAPSSEYLYSLDGDIYYDGDVFNAQGGFYWGEHSHEYFYHYFLAYCTANQYTITLNQQDGYGGQESISVTYDSKPTTLTSIPKRDGYFFKGYYTEKNGGGTRYYDEQGNGLIEYIIIGNITLYACWSTEFAWTYPKTQGAEWNLKAFEWNDLITFVNKKRLALGKTEFSFTPAIKDETVFTAAIYNEMVNAIGKGTPVSSGKPITADLMNELVTNANAMK